jgi:hypothetical protein
MFNELGVYLYIYGVDQQHEHRQARLRGDVYKSAVSRYSNADTSEGLVQDMKFAADLATNCKTKIDEWKEQKEIRFRKREGAAVPT